MLQLRNTLLPCEYEWTRFVCNYNAIKNEPTKKQHKRNELYQQGQVCWEKDNKPFYW